MERGQEGRPAHGTDETVETIEPVGAQAEGDAHDEPIEHGASTEGPSPRHVPGGGPPAHWLAYIRARAPWLLVPGGGLLADAGSGLTPDVVPHGPAARVAPWPTVDRPSGARAESPSAPDDRRATTEPTDDRVDGGGYGQHPGRGSDTLAPLSGVPASDPEVHLTGGGPLAIEDGGRPGGRDDRPRNSPDEGVARRSPPPIAPDAQREASSHAVPPVFIADEAAVVTRPSRLDPLPSPEPAGQPRPPIAWPALPKREIGAHGAPGDSWPPSPARTPRSHFPMTTPEPPTTQRAAAPFEPPRAPSRRDVPRPDPDGWRVRATAPETDIPARLVLPPWPDLPEPPPDDDDPDWRAIERRLHRAARLDREQRRR